MVVYNGELSDETVLEKSREVFQNYFYKLDDILKDFKKSESIKQQKDIFKPKQYWISYVGNNKNKFIEAKIYLYIQNEMVANYNKGYYSVDMIKVGKNKFIKEQKMYAFHDADKSLGCEFTISSHFIEETCTINICIERFVK